MGTKLIPTFESFLELMKVSVLQAFVGFISFPAKHELKNPWFASFFYRPPLGA